MGRQVGIRLRLHQDWIWAAAAAAALAVFSDRSLTDRVGVAGGRGFSADYITEARPAFDALVNGHIAQFLHRAPVYGGSLLLRAPFVLIARAFGAGEDWMYRASVIPALLACAALAFWLASRVGRSGARWLVPLVVVGTCVLNRMAMEAVIDGHPEELLGAVLCVAAVLCAIADRPIWAGVLLGLAIPNKEWALLAVGPVLVALPRRRLLAVTWAAATAGVIIAPFVIAGAVDTSHGLQGLPGAYTGSIFNPWQVWWFFGKFHTFLGWRSPPGWLPGLSHPLIIGISVPLSLLYVHRRRHRSSTAVDALLLLSFLLLLRCMLDPWDVSYYSTGFLVALLAWEVLRFNRLPVLALSASLIAWILYLKIPQHVSFDKQALSFLLVSAPAVAAIAYALYLPSSGERLIRRVTRRVSAKPTVDRGAEIGKA